MNRGDMDAVFGLMLLLLLGVSHGVETHCDGRQNGAVCFGPLGGTLVLRLMDDASRIFKYDWKKGETVILQGRKHRIIDNKLTNRSSFTPSNGTFRISDLSWNDRGEYTIEFFVDSTGSNKATQTLQLNIQVPVSSVRLTSECLSEGEKRVSCSSQEGDSPQYSWTLNGRTLGDSQLLSGNSEHQNITLKQDQSGRLACTVRNQVNSVTREEQISTCGFKFFDCTLLNGTYITKWLLPTNETQCIQSTAVGVETHCDGRQNGAVCFGPLGGTLVLRLMDDASRIFKYDWKKGETVILQGRKHRIIDNKLTNRSSFTPSNGTFRISDLSWNDRGEYTIEFFVDSTGSNKATQTLQLNIQVPVSSVRLTSECLSEGEKRVSCSSQEGDSPQYSWTLNGRTLSDSKLLSGNSASQTITLKQDQSGRLACTVRNQVNSVTREEQISTCGFQFFDCTLLNGTYITKWLRLTNETQCVQSTAVGVETHCDGRQNGAVCFGPLGGTLVLRLMDDASRIFKYDWKKGETVILQGRKDTIIYIQIIDRSSFTPSNGTFRISDLSWNDSGEYTIELFVDSSGSNKATQTLQLNIRVPVSSVGLTSECLSEGEKRVSCSSQEGDSPQYSWTLNGRTLSDSQLLSGNSASQTITLKQDQSGRLACTVRNQVNSVTREEQISTCGFQFFDCTLLNGTYITKWLLPTHETECVQSTTPGGLPLLVNVLRAAVVILVLVGTAVYVALKKRKSQKAEGSAGIEMSEYENASGMRAESRGSPSEL